MKKPLWIVAALFLIAGSAYAYGGKIAYFDIQTVMNKTTLGKKYQGIASGYYESRKKVLDTDAEEIQKLQEDYDKQKQVKRNDPGQKEKEEIINRKIAKFEKMRAEFGDEIGKKNEELTNEFNQHVFAVLKDIAKREKLSLILNRTITISKVEVQSVVYAEEGLDITGKIVAEMNNKEVVK